MFILDRSYCRYGAYVVQVSRPELSALLPCPQWCHKTELHYTLVVLLQTAVSAMIIIEDIMADNSDFEALLLTLCCVNPDIAFYWRGRVTSSYISYTSSLFNTNAPLKVKWSVRPKRIEVQNLHSLRYKITLETTFLFSAICRPDLTLILGVDREFLLPKVWVSVGWGQMLTETEIKCTAAWRWKCPPWHICIMLEVSSAAIRTTTMIMHPDTEDTAAFYFIQGVQL